MVLESTHKSGNTQFREDIRNNSFTGNTSGLMPGLLQGNVAILPAQYAQEFLQYCELNPKPCPVIGVSQPGDPSIPNLGEDLDIRIDVPEYHVFNDGQFSESLHDIKHLWQNGSVAIIIGCSYSFEEALISAGYPIRNIDQNLNVSMYNTTIATQATEHFSGNTVVSMRPFKRKDVDAVCEITARFPKTHGAPIYIGDPQAIGIKNIHQPDYGDAVEILEDEVPVFWGCGVTSQHILRQAKLPHIITHAPGKMLITDIYYDQL